LTRPAGPQVLLIAGQSGAVPAGPARPAGQYDPLLRTAAGERSESRLASRLQAWPGPARDGPGWVGPAVMAPVMAACVRRSNALLGYAGSLVYREAARYPGMMASVVPVGAWGVGEGGGSPEGGRGEVARERRGD
jgi:hypothetical protein